MNAQGERGHTKELNHRVKSLEDEKNKLEDKLSKQQHEREDNAAKAHDALEDEKRKLEDELKRQQKTHEDAVAKANYR
jgi:predicted  nucleic acid-binding Zn-ribbon protein